ncbi:unnamed protein product [marine sediment metagenome]|uniref:Uncharacterized protein n=1 Tax=marine sediment metagenome TaxID=412755 RepID=X1ATY2_9ZZZZ
MRKIENDFRVWRVSERDAYVMSIIEDFFKRTLNEEMVTRSENPEGAPKSVLATQFGYRLPTKEFNMRNVGMLFTEDDYLPVIALESYIEKRFLRILESRGIPYEEIFEEDES